MCVCVRPDVTHGLCHRTQPQPIDVTEAPLALPYFGHTKDTAYPHLTSSEISLIVSLMIHVLLTCRNEILLCDGEGCDVAVHQACYAVARVPRGKWYCDACKDKLDLSKPNCVCCPVVGGALRKVSFSASTHVHIIYISDRVMTCMSC